MSVLDSHGRPTFNAQAAFDKIMAVLGQMAQHLSELSVRVAKLEEKP